MIRPPLQALLAAHVPLTDIVGQRISDVARFTGETFPAVVYTFDSDEPASIGVGGERKATCRLAVVFDENNVGADAWPLCIAAVIAGINVSTDGVTLTDLVELDMLDELTFADDQGTEVGIPASVVSVEIYYKLA